MKQVFLGRGLVASLTSLLMTASLAQAADGDSGNVCILAVSASYNRNAAMIASMESVYSCDGQPQMRMNSVSSISFTQEVSGQLAKFITRNYRAVSCQTITATPSNMLAQHFCTLVRQ